MKTIFGLWALLIMATLSSCGVQSIPIANNKVEASLAEVNNQYKRRADLIPNLVKVVKGYAGHEKETLTAVVEARANATKQNINVSQLTPEALANFQKAQGNLSQALGKLMVVVEKYPDLKANSNFRDLQTQLEGTENRITIARRRFNEAVENFNNLVTVIPTSWTNSWFFKFNKKPYFELDESEKESVQKPPEVNF